MNAANLAMIILITFVSIATSPVAGKWWSIEAGGSRGNQSISLRLAVQDANLTGTVTEFTSQPRAILKGTTNGNDFTFETTGFFNGKEVTVIWSGNVTDDEMTVRRKIQFDD